MCTCRSTTTHDLSYWNERPRAWELGEGVGMESVRYRPLVDLTPANVFPDDLHLMLRVTDKLLDGTVEVAEQHNARG